LVGHGWRILSLEFAVLVLGEDLELVCGI
jgi:hypothetical protein